MEKSREKRSDEQLMCICGHPYHFHDRPYDEKKKLFHFTHSGQCSECDCKNYKDKEDSI